MKIAIVGSKNGNISSEMEKTVQCLKGLKKDIEVEVVDKMRDVSKDTDIALIDSSVEDLLSKEGIFIRANPKSELL